MDFDPANGTVQRTPTGSANAEDGRQYDQRLINAVKREALVRQALVETYMVLDRFDDAAKECSNILRLDNSRAQALFYRARCFALMTPPNWERALKDMKAFQTRQGGNVPANEAIRVSKLIGRYEAELKTTKRGAESESDSR